MINAGHGGIINVSWLMAFDDRPGWTIYLVANAFATRFTENLARELGRIRCRGPGVVRGSGGRHRVLQACRLRRFGVSRRRRDDRRGRGGSLSGRVGEW
jgi:short-subunit dehydrogenase